MASTNKTTNYELSQFIGTDKPAWLNDYNQDMVKIDTQMKANEDANEVTEGKADTNASNIGTLANLNTSAKTDLVSAVNEVYNTAGTASNVAQSASETASSASQGVDAVNDYLNLTTFTDYNYDDNAIQKSGVTCTSGKISIARNRLGTLGKIYGRIGGLNTVAWGTGKITVNVDTGFKPDEDIVISPAGFATSGSQYDVLYTTPVNLTIKTDGKVEIEFSTTDTGTNNRYQVILTPSLYFIKNFGDTYDPGQGQ